MANYHAAIAGNGKLAEWPMPEFPLREEMITETWNIQAGFLHLPELPGLGVQLTKKTERRYPFKKDAVYSCLPVKQLHYKKAIGNKSTKSFNH
jgi:L-alanine-DL-glutamate epimerase-like enolase superfamily enzyme